MARPCIITDHALDRFAERHLELAGLTAGESRQALLAELERGVPFGGQFGDDELLLLPSGLVAVIRWAEGVGIVKTVLTRNQAIANMQSHGVLPTAVRRRPRPVPISHNQEASEPDPPPLLPRVENMLRQVVAQHLAEGIGKKQRNARLREMGYDPAGPVGDAYRALFRAAREAKQVADRDEALRKRRQA
jgi:hypothetical protein